MPNFSLQNASGYSTGDLRRFFARGLEVMGIRRRVLIIVYASPIRSRGCADVAGAKFQALPRIVIAVAPPSRFTKKRFARLFMHETAHVLGYEHEQMPHQLLYSLGQTPRWAYDLPLRYNHRAPRQLPFLR